MSENFIEWLVSETERRGWSNNQLARRADLSHSMVSRVLNRERKISADFCLRIANALGEPGEKVLRLAGILPPSTKDDDATLNDIMELARNLPPEEREDLLKYAQFLYQKLNNQ